MKKTLCLTMVLTGLISAAYAFDYETTVQGMTPAKIQAFAKRLLDQGNHTEVIMSAE